MIARVCLLYCMCLYMFMCESIYTDVVHGVSVAIKWQISYNLVMFARIEAHQNTKDGKNDDICIQAKDPDE